MAELTQARKEEIRQIMIDALNGMGSRFFYVRLNFQTIEEAVYAANLWEGASRPNCLRYNGRLPTEVDVYPKASAGQMKMPDGMLVCR